MHINFTIRKRVSTPDVDEHKLFKYTAAIALRCIQTIFRKQI